MCMYVYKCMTVNQYVLGVVAYFDRDRRMDLLGIESWQVLSACHCEGEEGEKKGKGMSWRNRKGEDSDEGKGQRKGGEKERGMTKI